VATEAEHTKCSPQLFEAKAALAQMRLESGNRSAERELVQIRREASSKGLFLIAQKAALPKQSVAIDRVHN